MTVADTLRVYGSIRTAHLERFRVMMPATVIYQRRRYDYDESLVADQPNPIQMTRIQTVLHLLSHRYKFVELNEPMVSTRWVDLLAQTLAIRIRGGLGQNRTRISAYCIGYSDPAEEVVDRRPWVTAPIAKFGTRLFGNLLVRSTDRLAFGTTGSFQMYQSYVGAKTLLRRSKIFEALPAPCQCDVPNPDPALDDRLLFVGSFQERKGIRQLMAAWDRLSPTNPELKLHLIGKGPLLEEVVRWVDQQINVELEVDPPRHLVHEAMRRATSLILLSQRVGSWREQIGLPIVEALSHGLRVVATSETGLADWLREHKHVVLELGTDDQGVADGILRAKNSDQSREDILADLPLIDQRVEADQWMLSN